MQREPVANGLDWPMGTRAERRARTIPPGLWHIGNPYMNYYFLGPGQTNPAYHTGSDTSIEPGGGKGQPVHAIGNGTITFARRIPNSSWGNIVVQRLRLQNGTTIYARYAHVDPMRVREGDIVYRGQHIADESDAFGRFYPHLHFDISATLALQDHPADWPGLDHVRLAKDYVDPVMFIMRNRPMATLDQALLIAQQLTDVLNELKSAQTGNPLPPPPPNPLVTKYVQTTSSYVNLRKEPTTSSADIGDIPNKTQLKVQQSDIAPDWYKVVEGPWANGYVYGPLLSDRP